MTEFFTPDNTKMRATDRILVLKPIDNEKPRTAYGNVDPKIFTGENKLHAIKDDEYNHWYLKYDNGGIPEVLKQKFTSFKALLKHAEVYYRTRNLKIVEVID